MTIGLLDMLVNGTGYISNINSKGGTTYTLLNNYDITNTFIPLRLNAHDIFNGNGKTIINSTTTNGLFVINSIINNINNMPYIKNLNVNTYITNDRHGSIIRSDQNYFKVYKCNVNKTTLNTIQLDNNGSGSGGICGSDCSNFNIKSCNVSSSILTTYSGGISGMNTGSLENSKLIINKCTYTQTDENDTNLRDGGGIVGAYSARGLNSQVEIYNCSSLYNQSLMYKNPITYGGITGSYTACGQNSVVKIRGCNSNFNIDNEFGGICGKYTGCGNGSITTINNCTTSGFIRYMAGGIVGSYAGCGMKYELSSWLYEINYNPKITIFNCRSTGIISGGGGIIGAYAGFSSCDILIKHCKSIGDIISFDEIINDENVIIYGGGGIASPKTLINTDINLKNGKIKIIRCEVRGVIGSNCGGICGSYTGSIDKLLESPSAYENIDNPPTITISHCVLNSMININSISTAGYLLGSNSGYNTETSSGININVYFNNIIPPITSQLYVIGINNSIVKNIKNNDTPELSISKAPNGVSSETLIINLTEA